MAVSNEHRILTELAALYCKEMWELWAIAIEPKDTKIFDVVALRTSKPRAIITIEIKVSRADFLSGINRGQFSMFNKVTEMWLAYPGNFPITELPKHVGILKIKEKPVCPNHAVVGTDCPLACKNKKTIYYDVARKPKSNLSKKEIDYIYMAHSKNWIWHMLTKQTTDMIKNISLNVLNEVV